VATSSARSTIAERTAVLIVATSPSVSTVWRPAPPRHTVSPFAPASRSWLTPLVYHEFYAEPGIGTSAVGEVATVNHDAADNIFHDAPGRFPAIVEDAAPLHLLCTEYMS
jgi:hypothetical protein